MQRWLGGIDPTLVRRNGRWDEATRGWISHPNPITTRDGNIVGSSTESHSSTVIGFRDRCAQESDETSPHGDGRPEGRRPGRVHDIFGGWIPKTDVLGRKRERFDLYTVASSRRDLRGTKGFDGNTVHLHQGKSIPVLCRKAEDVHRLTTILLVQLEESRKGTMNSL